MANIFQQFAQPVRSIADYQNDAQQRESNALSLEGARRKNAMDAMTMEQGNQKRNALMQIASGWTPQTTAAQRIQSLRSNPLTFGEADALEKADLERQKTGAEVSAKDMETAAKRVGIIKTLAGHVLADPTPQNALIAIDIMERETGKPLPQERQRAMALQTPEQVIQWARANSVDADKLLPQQFQQGRGGTAAIVSYNPMDGTTRDAQIAPITQSADNAASQETARLNREQDAKDAAAGRGVQYAGQKIQRDRLNFDLGNSVVDAGGPAQAVLTKKFGKAEPGMRWKEDGSSEFIPGGSKDPKNNTSAIAKVTDAQDVLSLLDQAEPLLDKSTGSYLGAAIDEAGRAVGGATGGARAAAQLRALEGALISKMPKMSGPQSDKDVLLYKQMAGQIGDRTIPAEQKRAAMQTIREINNRHAGGAAKPAGAMSPEDTQAMEWANKNPNDPRAKQIKQRLGGG